MATLAEQLRDGTIRQYWANLLPGLRHAWQLINEMRRAFRAVPNAELLRVRTPEWDRDPDWEKRDALCIVFLALIEREMERPRGAKELMEEADRAAAASNKPPEEGEPAGLSDWKASQRAGVETCECCGKPYQAEAVDPAESGGR